MNDYPIPTLSDPLEPHEGSPFPEYVEPFDSEWWLDMKYQGVCDAFLGECFMDQVASYLTQFNAKKGASAANAASRFFKKAKVRRYLYIKTRKLSKKIELTQEKILADMLEVVEMAMGRKDMEMVLGHSEGVPVTHTGRDVNLKAATATLTQLGKFKELGMWVEKTESEVKNINFNFDMGNPSDAEKVINNK